MGDAALRDEPADGGVLLLRLAEEGGDPVVVEGQLSRLQRLVAQPPGASQLHRLLPRVLSPDAGLAGLEPGDRLPHRVVAAHPDEMQVRERGGQDRRQLFIGQLRFLPRQALQWQSWR